MHGQNINLPVCVCVCPSHFLSTRLHYRSDPSTDFYTDFYTDLRKGVPFEGLDDE